MKSILGNTRKADITFSRNGRINISARVSKSLGLTNGDIIDIIEDQDQEEFYLYVKYRSPVVGRHEGKVFRSNKSGHYFVASSITLCRYILSKCNVNERVSLSCGSPITLSSFGIALPIITSNILDHA